MAGENNKGGWKKVKYSSRLQEKKTTVCDGGVNWTQRKNKVETTQFLKEKETLIGIKYKFSNYKFVNNGIKTNEDVIVKEIIKLPWSEVMFG